MTSRDWTAEVTSLFLDVNIPLVRVISRLINWRPKVYGGIRASLSGLMPKNVPYRVGWRRPLASHNFYDEEAAIMVNWTSAGAEQFCSASATLMTGGTVNLTVERLDSEAWDWLVWDARSKLPPRYGREPSESAAKREAELTLVSLNTSLLHA